jgi:hypothetical protein
MDKILHQNMINTDWKKEIEFEKHNKNQTNE